MSTTLGRGEPECGPWQAVALAEFVAQVLSTAPAPKHRPYIVALDGRSSSGKTTLAARMARAVPDAHVIHTDDIAWFHSRFDWADLLISGVLQPLHRGEVVRYRPPVWDERDRGGSIDVPESAVLVIIEGVGATSQGLREYMDTTVYVQVDLSDVERRNAARVRSGETTADGVGGWMDEELPFVERQRPWEHAHLMVAGGAVIPSDPTQDVVISQRRNQALG